MVMVLEKYKSVFVQVHKISYKGHYNINYPHLIQSPNFLT